MKEFIISDASYLSNWHNKGTHFHLGYELIYAKNANIELYINNKVYRVKNNTIIFINCFEEHSYKIIEGSYDRYYVNFDRNIINKFIENPLLIALLNNRNKNIPHCFENVDFCEDIFKEFINQFENQDCFSQDVILSYLKLLLIQIYKTNKINLKQENIAKPIIYDIKKYIDDNFMKDIKISNLSEQFFIDKFYLSHSFKNTFGFSPKQYLTLNRLSYAK